MTPEAIHAYIMRAAARQLETTAEAKAIIAGGFGAQLKTLIAAISGNVCNGLAYEFEDFVATKNTSL